MVLQFSTALVSIYSGELQNLGFQIVACHGRYTLSGQMRYIITYESQRKGRVNLALPLLSSSKSWF
jgi:hypothetical protein